MISIKKPKIAVIALSLGIVSLCVGIGSADAKSPTSKADKQVSTKKVSAPDTTDAALRNIVTLITKALADKDANAMASLWTEDGVYVDDEGARFKGRTAIQQRFADAFEETNRPKLELVPDSQRVLSDSVVLSEGTVRVNEGSAKGAAETRYSIVFVKQNGTWLISSATETPVSAINDVNPLDDLAWLVGDWSAERNGGTIHMKAEWVGGNKNFITCTYETKAKKDSTPVISRQVIGWDPRNERPISWHFDSSGGFGYGNWVKNGKRWEIEASGVERDGSASVATNVISPNDKNTFMWQSLNRSVDGVAFTDTEPLKIQRTVQ